MSKLKWWHWLIIALLLGFIARVVIVLAFKKEIIKSIDGDKQAYIEKLNWYNSLTPEQKFAQTWRP